MKRYTGWIYIYSVVISIFAFIASPAYSLTLDEALALAKEKLPSYKASFIKTKSSEALYDASLGPYLPSLDTSAKYNRNDTSKTDYDSRVYDLTLSYTLFDGGKRRANREIAFLNLDTDKEDLRKNLIELVFNVKVAFYTAIAQKDAFEQRKIQLQDAQKDFEIAEGRYKFGVAKLSDVLQASVRLEQAKFNLVQAEGDFNKALSELNSIIGKALDSRYEIQGSLDIGMAPPDVNRLSDLSLQRPEIKQAELSLKIAESSKLLALSAFYPVLSADASYTRTSGGRSSTATSSPDERSVGVTATWNIFELGKFFKHKSSKFDIEVSSEKLNDTKRKLLLDVHKTYEDFTTASNKLKVAEQQLKQAEHNYSQAFGEYKVGKADILSLVQAESLLSTAREQLIQSRLNLVLSKTLLEKTAGVERFEPANGK
ncbi:MAG: TolC family protein [Nitrospirae bacterium]|nr:TolC family protein [Nitrospirota bacterium]